MRHLSWIVFVFVFVVGCGDVVQHDLPDSPPGTIDGATGDGRSADAGQADASATCPSYLGTWVTNAIGFDQDIAPTSRADFETRGDGVTGVVAGTPVPRDEYLACCGFSLDFIGPSGGQLIWAGNAVGGFEVRASCATGLCTTTAGVRVTFANPVAAVGYEYPGGTDAVVLDGAGNRISTMSVMGSGTNFLGYESGVPVSVLETTDGGGENIMTLLYHRCP